MTLETWFVLTVAAAFLLLGIAGSPLAWVAMHHRKTRLEQPDGNALERTDRRAAPARGPARAGRRGAPHSQRKTRPRRRLRIALERASSPQSAVPYRAGGEVPSRASSRNEDEPSLIAVPDLAATSGRRVTLFEPAQPALCRDLDTGRPGPRPT